MYDIFLVVALMNAHGKDFMSEIAWKSGVFEGISKFMSMYQRVAIYVTKS